MHICPNQGLFYAWLAQPASLCIKSHLSGQGPSILLAQDRSVTQKPHWGFCCFANVNLLCKQNSRQLPSFVCVHQPDGFKDLLTGDFCCRRLFILPGLRCCRGQVYGFPAPFWRRFPTCPHRVSSLGIPCRRSFGSQGSMKACRKHITMKQKFLGCIPSGFQWISGGSQGETGRNASASWKMLWIEHTIKSLDF